MGIGIPNVPPTSPNPPSPFFNLPPYYLDPALSFILLPRFTICYSPLPLLIQLLVKGERRDPIWSLRRRAFCHFMTHTSDACPTDYLALVWPMLNWTLSTKCTLIQSFMPVTGLLKNTCLFLALLYITAACTTQQGVANKKKCMNALFIDIFCLNISLFHREA